MDSISAIDVKLLWGNYNFDHIFSEVVDNSGGILCTWDSNVFHKEQHIISDNFVALYGTWNPIKAKLLMISIYASQSATGKRCLWSYITSLITRWNGDCMVMGDFNEVGFMEDRMGSVFNVQGANEFNNFISNSGLVEVQLEGYSFTWSHPSATKISKLDRFLVTEGLVSLFPYMSGICLDRHLSDHRPILLREVITDNGATPFRMYHYWFSLHGFEQMVTHTWNSIVLDDRNGMVRLKKKMQFLKKEIRQMQDIKSFDARDCMQKAKIQWTIEGDENSKFFHGIINRKLANLAIKGVMVDGEWMDDPSRVKEEFHSHFATRFQAPRVNRSRLNFRFPNRLIPDQVAELENPITRDEIRNAVWACGENKSPGPDGFTFEFFRKFWNIIGSNLCVAVEWFFDHSSLTKGCNSSCVALIPKTHDPKFVSDYRPISLIESLYKAIVFKVDFAKAYDFIRWDYLDDVLRSFGFGSKWCSWISGTLISRMDSILINGSPTAEFQFYCGLKQRDPLAPYLFILIMESLHLSFSRAVDAGILMGIKIDSSLTIFHLFYVDDRCSLVSDLISHCKIRMGNGMRTQFWNDTWVGDTQLRYMFPRIYALEVNKVCTVADKLQGSVALSLRRTVRGGVEAHQLDLLQNLIRPTILTNLEDKWVWNLNGKGVFRVKDDRNLLDESFLPKDSTATRWVKSIPIKIDVFAWKVYLDRLLTRLNLIRRGVHVPSLSCPVCNAAYEDMSHLLLSCDLANDVVQLVCRWWNLTWLPRGSYSEWISWFNSIRLCSRVKWMLEWVFYVTWWCLWNFRNQLLFATQNPRKDVIFDDIVSRSFTWCRARCNRTFSLG
nr:RNA-directed DNA polymerase, eukaryota [Tanacetum cinerariifolium]